MIPTTLLLAPLLAPFASALPGLSPSATRSTSDPRFTQWAAPGPDDVRSPCPGLNSLANHGFIHRSGRNLTLPHLIDGLYAGLSIGPDFTLAIGAAGLLSAPATELAAGAFDLNWLDQHDFPIEHDGSLSRRDAYYTGDDFSFYQPSWTQFLSYFGNDAATSLDTAAKARWARINDSLVHNPSVAYGPREFVLSYGETSLYLQTMGASLTSGVAPLNYVKMFFEQEKLPWELGWRPAAENITLVSLGAMILNLYPRSGEALPEGLQTITAGVVQDAFEGRDPVTGLLGNVTHALGVGAVP